MPQKNKKIIAIIGLMGVGKTTLGSKLAEKLGYYFVDSDHEIEDSTRQKISEIFATHGEQHFRELEKNIIKDIVARDENIVLSLGGGAFMNEETRNLLLAKAIVVWLDAPLDVILHRLSSKNNRPLLNNVNRRQVLEDLAQKRFPIYSMANIKVEVSNGGHEISLKKILKFLEENAKN